MKKIILSGFEPFGPYKYNPTKELVRVFDGREIDGVKVFGVVLPCSYTRAYRVLSDKVNEINPDAILSCGLASRIRRIRLEAVGRNIMDGPYPDVDGKEPKGERISSTGAPYYFTNVNNVMLANHLYENGIKCEVSVDAETYVCNTLIYKMARRIRDSAHHARFAFFHTPWTDNFLDKVKIESGKVVIREMELRKTVEVLARELARR